MCYGNAAKSLEIARSRLTPEQWQRFEREFDDFCVVQGLHSYAENSPNGPFYVAWAKWAFFQGRQHAIKDAHQVCLEGVKWSPEPSKHVQFYVNGTCHRLAVEISQLAAQPSQDERVADAQYERLAIAMMSDEQALASLERWKGRNE